MLKLYREFVIDVVLACIFAAGFAEADVGLGWRIVLGFLFVTTAFTALLGSFLLIAYTITGLRPPDDR